MSEGNINISFNMANIKDISELIANVKAKLKDMNPVMADIGAEVARIIDQHFIQGRGPHGKWKPYSSMTYLMATKTTGMTVHTGPMLRDTGTLQNSFIPKSFKKQVKIGSKLKTKSGKVLGAIHHYGSKMRVTPKVDAWFKSNFGIRLKVGTLVIPSRQMLYLEKHDRETILQMLTVYISNAYFPNS